jgi:small GTP-binding protein
LVAKIGWLHLSDLKIGASGSGWLQAEVREEFERDLRKLHDLSGPWHLVLITGDLTQTGSEKEFGLLHSALETFWGYLEGLGSTPVLLTVPGNHDFVRGSQSSAVRELAQKWRDDPEAPVRSWVDAPEPLQQLWRRGFGNYTKWAYRWREAHPLPPWLSIREGSLPGDFTARLITGQAHVTIVALNSAIFDLDGALPHSKLALDVGQLKRAFAPEAGPGQRNDLTLLLTHHPIHWLQQKIQANVLSFLEGGRAPAVQLCGGARTGSNPIHYFVPPLLTLQAPSLFADLGAGNRPCGYGAASIALDRAGELLEVWPRAATQTPLIGKTTLGPDASLKLEADGSIALLLSPLGLTAKEAPSSASLEEALLPTYAPAVLVSPAPPPPRLLGGDPSSGAPRVGASAPQARPKILTERRQVRSALESFARSATTGEADAKPSAANVVGLSPRPSLDVHQGKVIWLDWSTNGARLAVSTSYGGIEVYDTVSGKRLHSVQGSGEPIMDLVWSPEGEAFAFRSSRGIHLWDRSRVRRIAHSFTSYESACLAWSPDGARIACAERGVTILNTLSSTSDAHLPVNGSVQSLAWSRADSILISGCTVKPFLWLYHEAVGDMSWARAPLEGHHDVVFDLAFRPNSAQFASASSDRTIRIWDTAGKTVAVLEGHTSAVNSVSFSFDGRLLASKGDDDTVRLWRTDTWKQIVVIKELSARRWVSGLAFSPTAPALATLGHEGTGVRLWDIDTDALLRMAPRSATVHSVSAKVVLVGEGNAGKSCLALRLAEDRFEEMSPTHGMRFWPLPIERLDPGAKPPPGERREVVLWDMGGQSEYRLIHQLFLRDTAVALMLLEPRRGKAAIDEIEGWDKRFQDQAGAHRLVPKLLVGTKVDDDACPIDRPAFDGLARRLDFKVQVLTSAKSSKGIAELRRNLSEAIDWSKLGRTSRPELFQRLRCEIERLRDERRVVVMFDQFEKTIRENDPDRFDPEALRAVVKQLATQGVVADTRLADGARALVLEVEQLERYAGSLIVLARENPRGVPAVDLSTLLLPATAFPRMRSEERLRRDQELVVLECVIELLLEHGVCFRHEGLLVFPSLFPPSGADAGAALPHAVSLYYDFSGAVDNIYASLVASLAMSRRFGHPRLWEDRAEFSLGAGGVSGVRKVERKGSTARGVAHLDVYFDEFTPAEARTLFVGFIEDHLSAHGVEIFEHLQITCACGEAFLEGVVRRRLAEGQADIGCQVCDRRTPLTSGAREAKERSPELAQKLRALRTTVKEGRVKSVSEAKMSLSDAGKRDHMNQPIRILHLSDLHVDSSADVESLLQPLGADLRDSEEGLGTERLDYLVISGDVTNYASAEEFERAHKFVSVLIQEFGLTAERCVIVPGNHDLNWNEPAYGWKPQRQVDPKKLVQGTFVEMGAKGYLVRDDARYPDRFKNFSQHFYHPVLQQEYPLAVEQQCLTFLAPVDGLQFLAMNSAFEIDEHFPARSGIHPGALSRGLTEADRQVQRAKEDGQLAANARVLRLAVWHHPVSGNEKIEDDAFLGRLQQAGVRACLHGHVHEDRADLLKHFDRRAIHAIGAGSFGAPVRDRPESVPRLYNLMEIERDLSRIRVHTRCQRKGSGAWGGWAIWPGAGRGQMQTYYDIQLA